MSANKKSLENKLCRECLVELDENNTNVYDVRASQYICKNCCKLRSKQRYINRKNSSENNSAYMIYLLR